MGFAGGPTARIMHIAAEPRKAIAYYYRVRSNIVHRGKSQPREHSLVKDTLDELFAIFEEVLDATSPPETGR